jgi:SAM-dependent MidA family methyltransferase
MNTDLPAPDDAALEHSLRLSQLIREVLARSDGWMPFSRYMGLALYAPGLGYYSAGAAKLGAAGDFVTAPELSPLFARTLARQVAQVLEITGGDVLELGAGSGRLAFDLLLELAELGVLPERYRILDISPDLIARQRALLATLPAELAARVTWVDEPDEHFVGVMLGNEVLDALPVNVVAWRRDGLYERGVTVDEEGNFSWVEKRLGKGLLGMHAAQLPVEPDYVSEINLAAPALIRTLASRLKRGVMLWIDYGFPEAEYYHPQRVTGTLMCHYRHRAHDDPFHLPGLTDITAHVDFSAVAQAGLDADLDLLGYTTQESFLIGCGITDLLARVEPGSSEYLRRVAPVQKLLSPAEMGELFKIIALGRGVTAPLQGFNRGDRRASLGAGAQT